MGPLAISPTPGVTLGMLGIRKLRALASALDLSDELTQEALRVFGLMSDSWADWAVGDSPVWPNDISDDGTPFEFSASFDGSAPRLRMLAESQAEPISRVSTWAAGLALGQRLQAAGLADLTLFQQIQDLFVPHSGSHERFSLWHAAVLEQGQPALFKAYVNPGLFGVASAPYVVERALRRLGFEQAWADVQARLASNPGCDVRYFSVDLEAIESARVKVYLACSQTASAVDRLIGDSRNTQADDAQRWLSTLTASQGPFDARPILSCFSFRRGHADPDVTVHVPIRCYVKHDAEALDRVAQLLTPADTQRLARALEAVSERPLKVGRGLLTYASLRREAGAVRVTVYLAPEAYSITSRRPSAPPPSGFSSGVHKTLPRRLISSTNMADAQALVARQGELLRAQPLFEHLSGPGSPQEAQALVSHLSLLVLWLGDLFRFAHERATDPQVSPRLAEEVAAANARVQQFRIELEALPGLGLTLTSSSLYTEEHALIREVAFARVSDVISADNDCIRLGMILSVSATCEMLLRAGLAFIQRAAGTALPPSAPDAAPHPTADRHGQLSLITMSDSIAVEVFANIDRCFESVLRVVTAIDHATFGI